MQFKQWPLKGRCFSDWVFQNICFLFETWVASGYKLRQSLWMFWTSRGGACQRLLWPTFKTLGLKQLRLSSRAFITSSCNSIVIVFTLQNCSHDYCGGSKHIIVLSYRVTLPERITLIISWGTCKWNYAVHTHFDIRNKKHLVSELRQICEREILCNISTFTYMLIWIDLEYQYKKNKYFNIVISKITIFFSTEVIKNRYEILTILSNTSVYLYFNFECLKVFSLKLLIYFIAHRTDKPSWIVLDTLMSNMRIWYY